MHLPKNVAFNKASAYFRVQAFKLARMASLTKPFSYLQKTYHSSLNTVKFRYCQFKYWQLTVFAPNSDRPYNFKLSFWHEGPV